MICDDCQHLEFRNEYKIICRMHDCQLLDVKQCMHFKAIDEE